MKTGDHLPSTQKNKINQTYKPKKRRNKQKLTTNEIHDLMGVNRDTYKRNRGAIRRK